MSTSTSPESVSSPSISGISQPLRTATETPLAASAALCSVSPPIPEETPVDDSETLVLDSRAQMSPAEMVEQKLLTLLKGGLVPLSHVRVTGLPRGRGLA